MTDKLLIRAIYEDGVFKPLESIDLPDKELVEFEIEVLKKPRKVAKLKGLLAPYWDEQGPSVEDILEELRQERVQSFERLMRQIEEGFEEDDSSHK